ncbi:DNA/RNA non-specific endonuclease [Cyclobacterium jeungdonense]|uniref:Endonuclease n=1 Tax=Cyclobacterium jeungdonense TaxID=708087 RepID=A0ABT8CCJ0_9BACT|nr:DNA/RNA non-specific endonuclease [Cyclobacterium jeungdonense]MDN3690221.1 DNA/RNA non-specific endonuclease [Cyclobacterium jeungdonense]
MSIEEWQKSKNRFHSEKKETISEKTDVKAPKPVIDKSASKKPLKALPDNQGFSHDLIPLLLIANMPDGVPVQIVDHEFYLLAYQESYEQAAWVAYQLSKDELSGPYRRKDVFREDGVVITGSAHPDDYRLSGFDRGHLAPAADFSFSEQAMEKSFYMSNISPQLPGFNRGIWRKLEQQVRAWAREYEQVLVVTGPLFMTADPKHIGENEVLVPDYFFKVLFEIHPPSYKMLAFLLKNQKSNRPLLDYAISVDSLEQFSGIDFFFHLPDSIENELEKKVSYEDWLE